jgi:hypothetical protein
VSSVQGKAPSGRSRVLAPGAWLGVRVLVLAAVVLSCRAGSLRAWVDFSWFWVLGTELDGFWVEGFDSSPCDFKLLVSRLLPCTQPHLQGAPI